MAKEFLVFGKSGQVATDLKNVWGKRCKALGRRDCNITDPNNIASIMDKYQPRLVINAAAYTAVDKAEGLANQEQKEVFDLNAVAPKVIAQECAKRNIPFVQFSTDYVFDGAKTSPFLETDSTAPLSVYGESKLLGEKNVQEVGGKFLILRTSWVYSPHGSNFLKTMIRLMSERDEVKVVNDQYGAPTSSSALAFGVASLAEILLTKGSEFQGKKAGIYHYTAQGNTTWFGFAELILKHLQAHFQTDNKLPTRDPFHPILKKLTCSSLLPISTEDFPVAAKRPVNSRLSNEKFYNTFGFVLPSWEEQFEDVWRTICTQRGSFRN